MIKIVKIHTARPAGQVMFMGVLAWLAAASAQYTEKSEVWTASTSDTWETQDLSGVPFNMAANAVVEILFRDWYTSVGLFGGARGAGNQGNMYNAQPLQNYSASTSSSVLDNARRWLMPPAEVCCRLQKV